MLFPPLFGRLAPQSFFWACLGSGNEPTARHFFARQGEFSQEYRKYFKEIQRSIAEKEPPPGTLPFPKHALSYYSLICQLFAMFA
jgi:hypothetical protein